MHNLKSVTFPQAFLAARTHGVFKFTWNHKEYTTQRADENICDWYNILQENRRLRQAEWLSQYQATATF